jgi:periplasmic divalent cation tolerance protein
MLHAKLKRSTRAHARIVALDVSRAVALDGVFAVITGKDLPTKYGIIPWTKDETARAVDDVKYIGEPVAAVAAVDEETANAIALAVIEAKLAACVNILPGVRSVYRWEGGVCVDDEVQLLIKTTAARIEALRARALAIHPYALPELIVINVVDGNPAYIGWVRDSVAGAIDRAPDAE